MVKAIAAYLAVALLPAAAAIWLTSVHKASLESRIAAGQAQLEDARRSGRAIPMAGAADDFLPLPEALAVKRRILAVVGYIPSICGAATLDGLLMFAPAAECRRRAS